MTYTTKISARADSPSSCSRISAIGTYVPSRVVTNEEIARTVETSPDWIVQRCGIQERRFAAEDQYTSDLCEAAVRDLLGRYGVTVEDVSLIIVATTTPDYNFPSVACLLQQRLGIKHAGAIDLNATCSGFTYGLHIADSLVSAGMHRKVLVVAGDTLSKVTDHTDRSTCFLFGDGAGAVLVERDTENPCFLGYHLGTDGRGGEHLYRSNLSDHLGREESRGFIRQNGQHVFKWAVQTVSLGLMQLMQKVGLDLDAINWFIPHSANARIVEAICKRVGFPVERTLCSVKQYGNTSSASIPLALAQGISEGKLKYGDRAVVFGYGAGLVYAGLLLRWTLP